MENIKRIIFDFDNTLIIWRKEYLAVLRDIISGHGIVCDEAALNQAIGETINYVNRGMTINNVIKQAKELCDVEISRAFVKDWFQGLGERTIDLEDDVVDTLEYLYQKYDLVVLSNFNGQVQRSRAYHAGIRHYFSAFYGSESIPMKPHFESYMKAVGPYTRDECVMVGDNMKEDYEGANKIGMHAILLDRTGKYESTEEMTVIHKIKELKKIL